MLKSLSKLVAAGVAFSLLVLAGCDRDSGSGSAFADEDSILRYVPANTPYLLATGEQLPDEMLDDLEPKIDEMMDSYQVMFGAIFESAIADSGMHMSEDERQAFAGIFSEVMTLFSVEGMRDAGFERDSRMVFFGHGLLPVWRVEVSDEQKFEDTLAGFEEAAGTAMSVGEIDGQQYRYVGDDDASIIIAVMDGNAVFTALPGFFGDDELRQLLGLELPAQSIASTSTITDIVSTYGYTDHFVGFIDITRLVSTFAEGATGLDAGLLEAAEFDDSMLSAVCREEIMEMAAVMPRVVFGYDSVTRREMTGSMVIELRDDIANGLTEISSIVPGLGSDPGGFFSMGMSFDLAGLRSFYEARLDAVEANPYQCEFFEDMQAGLEQGRAALNQPLPPVAYSFRGFNAIIDNVEGLDFESGAPPESVDASLLIAMDDAQAMVAMGAMFSPEIASLNLEANGEPIELNLPDLSVVSDNIYAAMITDALAVSIGEGAESRVTEVLNAEPTEPPPFVSITMDAGKYYELIAESMLHDMQSLETVDGNSPMTPEAQEAVRDAMIAVGEIYDRFVVDVLFTQNGVEVRSKVTLAE